MQASLYEAVGGESTFRTLVAGFFAQVADDDVLSRVYPMDDLDGAEDRLRMFLIQYWGGPPAYSEQRGHPRLRMRHAPFTIGPVQRDAWLGAMKVALDGAGIEEPHRQRLWEYLQMTAQHLVNSSG